MMRISIPGLETKIPRAWGQLSPRTALTERENSRAPAPQLEKTYTPQRRRGSAKRNKQKHRETVGGPTQIS